MAYPVSVTYWGYQLIAKCKNLSPSACVPSELAVPQAWEFVIVLLTQVSNGSLTLSSQCNHAIIVTIGNNKQSS